MSTGFVARTPIFTRSLDVFGYELRTGVTSPNNPLTEVDFGEHLIQTSIDVKLDDITGGYPALIHLPAALLPRCDEIKWPKDQIVLALSVPTAHDTNGRKTIEHLASEGYRIALHNPSSESLPNPTSDARLVSMYALDATSPGCSTDFPASLSQAGHLTMMVRELETAHQYDHFRKLDFDYYEGTFFERPRLLHGTEIPADRIGILQLIARLQDPDVGLGEIELLVSRDVALSYKLLRLINAAFYGLPKQTDSIRRAVMFFGLERIKNWATVLLVNAVDFRPRELFNMAMIRARTCQMLAEDLGYSATEPFYVTGLFSLLDAIMDAPMANILERLNLIQEINDALLRRTGIYGLVLNSVLAFESGNPDAANLLPLTSEKTAVRAYLGGIRWANEFRKQIHGA